MKRAFYDWGGLLVWVIVVAIILFAATKRVWFDALQPGEKVLFWTNVAVAAGTLALAIATVASIFTTRAVIRGEDRRYQQSLAPYLVAAFQADRYGEINAFTISNAGRGLARDVSVYARGYVAPNPEDLAACQEVGGAAVRFPFSCRASYDVIAEKHSALAYLDDQGPPFDRAVVLEARILYFDSFGNTYETIYDDWYGRKSHWKTPAL